MTSACFILIFSEEKSPQRTILAFVFLSINVLWSPQAPVSVTSTAPTRAHVIQTPANAPVSLA